MGAVLYIPTMSFEQTGIKKGYYFGDHEDAVSMVETTKIQPATIEDSETIYRIAQAALNRLLGQSSLWTGLHRSASRYF